MDKADEVADVWFNESYQAVPFEPFEQVIVSGAATIRPGNVAEGLTIYYCDDKYTTKEKLLVKKRWKIYEKVEGFSYTIDIYEHTARESYEERYQDWKAASNLKFGNLEEIF